MDRSDLVVPSIRPGEEFLVLDDDVHGRELWAIDMEGATAPLHGCGSAARHVVEDPVIGAAWPLAAYGLGAPGVALLAQPATDLLGLGGSCALVLDPGLRGAAFMTQAALLDPSQPSSVTPLDAWWLTVGC